MIPRRSTSSHLIGLYGSLCIVHRSLLTCWIQVVQKDFVYDTAPQRLEVRTSKIESEQLELNTSKKTYEICKETCKDVWRETYSLLRDLKRPMEYAKRPVKMKYEERLIQKTYWRWIESQRCEIRGRNLNQNDFCILTLCDIELCVILRCCGNWGRNGNQNNLCIMNIYDTVAPRDSSEKVESEHLLHTDSI